MHPIRILIHSVPLLVLVVQVSLPVCVEVPSDSEGVQGYPMKLTCISCMRREEVETTTEVNWYFNSSTGKLQTLIFTFRSEKDNYTNMNWTGRLQWDGSHDLQDVSISIVNITQSDAGTYTCEVKREFIYKVYRKSLTSTKVIFLEVKSEASEDTTAVYSEIMMYFLLVFLTFWLLVEMVYCYRKISKADEVAQDNAD
ncbi:sodium channel regulatory subunit beta-3 isoform X2 [Amia ocellicauda]|uniref:sodium channel regulatory subunit beta-3 isoform X2 n=1 Tax=Amia ocellicauda TaxID=2972642 RepID=UPI003464B624